MKSKIPDNRENAIYFSEMMKLLRKQKRIKSITLHRYCHSLIMEERVVTLHHESIDDRMAIGNRLFQSGHFYFDKKHFGIISYIEHGKIESSIHVILSKNLYCAEMKTERTMIEAALRPLHFWQRWFMIGETRQHSVQHNG